MLPGTEVAVHRHPNSNEGRFGCQVPKGVWHTVEVIEPSVIYEAKDGRYGEDGSEGYDVK